MKKFHKGVWHAINGKVQKKQKKKVRTLTSEG